MSDAQFITMALRLVKFSATKNNRWALEISEANKCLCCAGMRTQVQSRELSRKHWHEGAYL